MEKYCHLVLFKCIFEIKTVVFGHYTSIGCSRKSAGFSSFCSSQSDNSYISISFNGN